MARWRRWLALLSLLFVAALVGLQLYLGSSFAARLVATQLGDLLASPVDIARLDGRLVGSTSVHGLTLHDASSGDPLLTIDCLVVDVSLLSAARGRRLPQQVDVHGAHLHLRFNREGKLITRLPRLPSAGGLPRLRLNHLRVTLDQEGRPPLTIQGVRATIEPRDGENLQGLIDDPVLGLVQAGGSFRKGRLHLALRSDGVPLSRERFRSFPFVPTTLTQHVELSGIVPMKLDLWLGEPGTRPRYRVDFRKAQARLLQPGQPPFVVASTAGVVEGSEGGFLFQGAARDPEWGNWRIVADRAPGRPGVTLHLDTDEVILDAEHLVRVPYVPRSIWDQVRASGSAGAQLVVRLPPGGKAGLRYRAELRPRDAEVHISAVDLNASQTRGLVVIEDGHVTLKKVQAATAEGTIQCDGDLDFRTTPSRMQFGVAVQALRLRKLPGSWELPRALDGKVTGSAQLTVTTLPGRLRTEGKGQGRIDEASIAGIRAREPIPLRLTADGRRFRLLPRVPLMDTLLRPVSRRIEAGRDQVVRAFYQVIGRPVPTYLVADFAWEGEMAELMQHLQMELPEKVRGALALQGRLALPLENPRDVRQHDVEGSLSGPALTLGKVNLEQWQAKVRLQAGHLNVDVGAQVAGEAMTCQVRGALPEPGQAARGSLHAQCGAVRLATGWVLDEAGLASRDLRVQTQVGNFTGRLAWDQVSRTGTIDLASPQVQRKGVSCQDLHARCALGEEGIDYLLTSRLFSGHLKVEGHYPPRPFQIGDNPDGLVSVKAVELGAIGRALGIRSVGEQLRGTAALHLPYRHEVGRSWPTGRGSFEVRHLRWQEAEISEQLRGDVRLTDEGLLLREIFGMVGGGSLRLAGGFRFGQQAPGWFDLRLQGVEIGRTDLLEEERRSLIQGPVDLNFRGHLGAECRGSGSVTLLRGRILGIEVSDWRVPVEFTWIPSRGATEIHIRESGAQIGSGRATLRMSLRQMGGWQVDGQVTLVEATLRSLAGLLGDVSNYARGRVSGRIDFSGTDLQSLTDVTANVQAKLSDAQMLQLPILRLIVPHSVPGQGTLEFQSGELRGRLSQGVFRIAELVLDSSLLQLVVQGSATLQGRLDLEVTGQTTSPTINPLGLRWILQQLPPIGPVPVGLLVRATEALADRVIHLRITGTLRSPRVQVEPVRVLSDQAVRFFLNRAIQTTGH